MNPYYWGPKASATDKPGMLLGAYPTTDTLAALASTGLVSWEVKAESWAALGLHDPTARPAAPIDLKDEDRDVAAAACRALVKADQGTSCDDKFTLGKFKGAAHLQMGIAALGLIASTLY